MGSAGSAYYSDWTISNAARRNTLPTPPTMFTAAPASYYIPSVTLTWSGTVAGTSAIKNYIIQQATSSNGTTWSGWSAVTTVSSTATSGTYLAMPSNVDGMRTKYRIAVTDALDAVSGYVESNIVTKQLAPETPIVVSPTNGSTIYNMQPRFLITTGGAPDGRIQRVAVRIDNGSWVNSLNNPSLFSVSGNLANGVSTIYRPNALVVGTHTVTIRSVNDSGNSSDIVRTFSIGQALTINTIQFFTIVKANHINDIRTATRCILPSGAPPVVMRNLGCML
jgi:hypothetical protein